MQRIPNAVVVAVGFLLKFPGARLEKGSSVDASWNIINGITLTPPLFHLRSISHLGHKLTDRNIDIDLHLHKIAALRRTVHLSSALGPPIL
jgi:hypothetical protein